MSKLVFAAAAACLTIAAPAFAGERSFTHEGVTYTYTATQADNGVQVLEGTASKGGKFRLTVKNGWVDGYVNNTRVSFRAPRRNAPAQVAQR